MSDLDKPAWREDDDIPSPEQHPPERERAREILHWIEQMRDPLWPGLSESDWAQLAEPVARAYLSAMREQSVLFGLLHDEGWTFADIEKALRPEGKPGDGE